MGELEQEPLAIDEPFLMRPSLAACQKYVPWLTAACSEGAPPNTEGFQVSVSARVNHILQSSQTFNFYRGGNQNE